MQQDGDEASNQLSGEENKPLKVTLAEDDKDDQELFQEAVEKTGTDVDLTVVNNGQELIDDLKNAGKENPDIIFLDINMPVKDGKQTLREIREDDDLKDIPAVMLSTSDHPKDIHESLEAGADLYVKKPNSFNSFIHILKKIFSFGWAGRMLRSAWKSFFITEHHTTGEDS